MHFRPDIAGLRTVAIFPILLFHAGVEQLPGGFVGVDIFFTISGFLITSLILRDLELGRFSLFQFYRRRIVRILPALLVVLAFTLAAGYLLLLPTEFQDVAYSSSAAAIFLSNIYFFNTADYFAASSEATVLLHTWSLSIEEQFYIFYPALILAVYIWAPKALRATVVAMVVASFLLALSLSPSAAFYLLPSRAWELGIGALVALGVFPALGVRLHRQLAAVAGLVLVLGTILLIHPSDRFPAPLAVVPVLGTALLIAYGRDTLVARFLSLPFMQWIGAISFSLYLWHWPIIVFYRLQTGMALSGVETIGLVVVSICCAALTYIWVERPMLERFRNDVRLSNRRIVAIGLTALAGMAGMAFAAPPLAQATRTFPPDVEQVASYMHYRDTPDYKYQFRRGECFQGTADPKPAASCLALATDKKNVVVMGDSHAAHLWRAIAERYGQVNVIQATASGCRPLLDATGAERCTGLMKHVFEGLIDQEKVDAVILSGRWKASEQDALHNTVDWISLRNIPVVVIGPTIEYQGDFPAILGRALLVGRTDMVEQLRHHSLEEVENSIGQALKGTSAVYVSLHQILCPDRNCPHRTASGAPYHFDYGHLTLEAAREVVARIPAFDSLLLPLGRPEGRVYAAPARD